MKLNEILKTLNEGNNIFCREGCPEFAIALHDIFGYDLKLLIDKSREWDNEMPGDKRKVFPFMAHVFAEDGNGNKFDVHGEKNLSNMVRDFQLKDPYVKDVSKNELIEEYMGMEKPFCGLNQDLLEEAKKIIQKNPEKYKNN